MFVSGRLHSDCCNVTDRRGRYPVGLETSQSAGWRVAMPRTNESEGLAFWKRTSRMNSSPQLIVLHLLFICFAALTVCHGQSGAGTLQGTITDPSGAVIPGAIIVITSDATGVQRELSSNSAGLYVAADLPAGRYRLLASATGFAKQQFNDVELAVGAVRNLDVQLTLGNLENVVNVTATTANID